MTAAAAAPVPPRLAAASAVEKAASDSAVPSSAAPLHASVSVEQVVYPQHKKRPRGRPGKKRAVGAGERAFERDVLTASRML